MLQKGIGVELFALMMTKKKQELLQLTNREEGFSMDTASAGLKDANQAGQY